MGAFDYSRRHSSEVKVGSTAIGGANPIRLQSMTNTSTMDTPGSVAQCMRIAAAGADIVRLTAQGVREAVNIGCIRGELRAKGVDVPLVADIHFNPKAAFEAARQVEKVRINPGNFVDPGRTFRKISYTDSEYAAELARIDEALTPFLELCRQNGTAIRIGVNHGSLSDRIMSRFGDTPAGMVESAMEFLRVCVRRNFTDVVISIKASNVRIMVETVRRLVSAMDAEDMHFPLHLGVTEAGDGEDGRVKSAVGIGTLLAQGIGDTIRVSLSEDPENEVPVARYLVDYISSWADAPAIPGDFAPGYDPVAPQRRPTAAVGSVGGENTPVVVAARSVEDYDVDSAPDLFADTWSGYVEIASDADDKTLTALPADKVVVVTSTHPDFQGAVSALVHRMQSLGVANPVIVKAVYSGLPADEVMLRASVDLGVPVMNGLADGLWIEADSMTPAAAARLAFGILQSARLRITRTEYIACPGCGRTLFDLQTTLRRVKEATASLKGLKIGVMGCIVNGPGEMADADYGYVGAGAGKVSLYKGKECIEKNIPEAEAVSRLIEFINNDRR
ncbi:MAG: (E)-4-hydroxy-3-methylbut-2-enyl-diphosphate synthase [Muribaculaceae bacterium]|nr:(E)-4-hydroxy-3-methylbut-2-enyl-diphosphate synthase [Muribaculaceae bacterium]